MRIRLTRSWIAMVLAVLLGFAATWSASAQEAKTWDQARVTELSSQLFDATKAIRSSWRNEPTRTDLASMSQRASKEFSDILKLLERSVRQLSTRLGEGKGMQETLPIARKIGSLLNDANREVGKLSPSGTTIAKFTPAMELINEISPYYGGGTFYEDVEPLGESS